ncbi:hypothetical protein [Pedobacter yulinensis]|nr:hypothetical protein [Pedobacter yulinensis]
MRDPGSNIKLKRDYKFKSSRLGEGRYLTIAIVVALAAFILLMYFL